MTGSTIDLGVLPPTGSAEAPAGSADKPPASAPVSGWAGRGTRWAAGVLGVALMLATTASAAPRRPWAVPHFAVPGVGSTSGPFVLTGENLYLVDWRDRESGSRLRAYRLSDGSQLWETTADEAYVVAGMPTPLWYGTAGVPVRSAWLDPETGQPLWQGEGQLVAVIGDRLVVSHRVPPEPGDADLRWERESLSILDRPTTSEVWRLSPVDGWESVPAGSGHGDWLLAVGGGQLGSYDLATGTRLATVEVSVADRVWPQVSGDVVLVWQPQAEPALRAYDLETLTLLWAREGTGGRFWNLGRCGELLCLQSDTGTMTAVDLAIGERAWSQRWPPDSTVDVGWLEGHIVVGDPGGTDQRVIDASTGAVVLELGEWQPHHHSGGSELGPLVARYDSPGRPLTVYGGRTWFARLHLHPARLEVLGAVASGGTWCTTTTSYIACDNEGTVQVWRIGAAP